MISAADGVNPNHVECADHWILWIHLGLQEDEFLAAPTPDSVTREIEVKGCGVEQDDDFVGVVAVLDVDDHQPCFR